MRPACKIPLVASMTFLSAPALAGDLQVWPDLLVTASAGKGWQVSGEVIGRFTVRDDRAEQGEYRLHAGRTILPGMVLWAGYVHLDTITDGHLTQREDQFLGQLNWAVGRIGPVRFTLRTRLEHRQISGTTEAAWRFRELVRAELPLKDVRLVGWVEPFIDLNRTAAVQTRWDQFRYFAGVSLPVNRHLDLETGLLRQQVHRLSGDFANTVVPLILSARL